MVHVHAYSNGIYLSLDNLPFCDTPIHTMPFCDTPIHTTPFCDTPIHTTPFCDVKVMNYIYNVNTYTYVEDF